MKIDTSELSALAGDAYSSAGKIAAGASAAMRKTAFDIERTAKAAAPVDTGALRASISTDTTATTAEVGPTVKYGEFVELGTSRMGPQPFLGPAFDRHLPEFQRAVGDLAQGMLR